MEVLKWLTIVLKLDLKRKNNMDAKKLKLISSELKKASKMHKAQALKIDGMLKSLKK